MRPTVEALATVCRVITFTLCDERGAGTPHDPAAPLDSFVEQVRAALDEVNLAQAAICGVSFGGIVALRFAAQHPDRTSSLILVSTPGPHWSLKRKHQIYARAPWLFGPVFLAEAPWRLWHEIELALPDRGSRWRFVSKQLRTLFEAPLSLPGMAARARLISESQRASDCLQVVAPTLVVHGEGQLDHVVSVEGTSDYGRLIRGARTVVLERTGHLGTMTHPHDFARVVGAFLEDVGTGRSANTAGAGAAGCPAVA
jgi:pimeloyl-ACP methyl ester carboxylesterase